MDDLERSDEDLVGRYHRTGDVDVLDALFRRHVGLVRGTVYPMVLNHADADDLTQEVFARAARGMSKYRGQSTFSTWLYRIAMNTTHSFLRSRHRREQKLADCRGDESPARAEDKPDNRVISGERHDEITQALAELPATQRAAITLVAIQGMSGGEAAKAENCSRATLYWRIHQARKTLGEKLDRGAP